MSWIVIIELACTAGLLAIIAHLICRLYDEQQKVRKLQVENTFLQEMANAAIRRANPPHSLSINEDCGRPQSR